MRVFDIEGLGYSSAIINIGTEVILLLDVELSQDDRVDIMLGAMSRLD